MQHYFIRLCVIGTLLGLAPSWPAQDADAATPTLNAQSFLPSPFARDILSVNRARIAPPLTFTGALNFHYTDQPLVLVGRDGHGRELTEKVVGSRLMGEVLLAFAPWDYIDIGVAMPFILMGSGDGEGFTGYPDTSGFRIGELRASLKVAFMQLPVAALGVQVDVTAPTGDVEGFVSNGLTVHPKLVFDFEVDRFRGAINAGAVVRFEDTEIIPAASAGGVPYLTVGHQLTAGLGGEVRLVDEMWLVGEAYARTDLLAPFSEENGSTLEAMGAIRYSPVPEFTMTVGGGGGTPVLNGFGTAVWRAFAELRFQVQPRLDDDADGVNDRTDQCPHFPEDMDGHQDTDGCPDPDNDGDGFLDVDDKCPDEAEDLDGFEDGDGCPEPDNDGDGVMDGDDACPQDPEDADGYADGDGCPDLDDDGDGFEDTVDRCPRVAEILNGFEDDDGCPDYPGVTVRGDEILLLQAVSFDKKERLTAPSRVPLRSLAKLIHAKPEWARVRVLVHTDGKGEAAAQLARTQARGEAIVRVLVIEGVDLHRLEIRAMGAAEPVASDRSKAGRRANNRVELRAVFAPGHGPAASPEGEGAGEAP